MHDAEDRLLEAVTAEPGPFDDLTLVLRAAKAEGLPWRRAWDLAVREMQPDRQAGVAARRLLDDDRRLRAEVVPHLRAAYEDRALTEAERAEVERLAELRTSPAVPASALAA